MEQMFLGGLLPGTLLLILTAWWGIRQDAGAVAREPFSRIDAARAVWEAKWELLLPAVVIFVLFGGFATPVETAAFTALYAFVVETFVYRDFRSPRQLARVFAEAGLLIGGVLLILGVALGLTNYLIDAEIPAHAVAWATGSIHSPLLFLLMLNGFLLLVGCLMEIFPAIVVVVPLIVPLGVAFGIDPVHLGIIFLANLELGYLMPPVGMNLLIASYRFGKPIGEVCRASLPMMLVLLTGVLLITYIPPLTTFLPRLFAK
jgi:tripartite ATP-independent transporter DctM subunit